MTEYRVTLEPDGLTVAVAEDRTLLDAIAAAGVSIHSLCGGRGICQRCRVRVRSGQARTEPGGRVPGEPHVLACLTRPAGDLVVEVPATSRLEAEQILTGEARWDGVFTPAESAPDTSARLFVASPLAFKLYLELPRPTLNDSVSDLQRVLRELRRQRRLEPVHVPLEVLRGLSGTLRDAGWDVTVSITRADSGYEVIDVEPGDTSHRAFGVAVDLGTTTVVAHLVDLGSGRTLGASGMVNRQAAYGEDVISRIIHAGEPGGPGRLRAAALESINGVIGDLARAHRVEAREIVGAVVAGNTTMIHLLLGLEPAYIRREPYIPAATSLPVLRAGACGLRIHPRALVAIMPGVASYVGGDITADVLAAGLDDRDELAMLIDVGTNGETVVGNREFLVSCACSAGPAFEGGGITWGMRAARGAIQRVSLDEAGRLAWSTVEGAPPRGMCGSGLVDLLAAMLRAGIVDRAGRLNPDAPQVRSGPDGLEVVVVPGTETASGRDLVLTEADLATLLRSKAAVYAGVALLARRVGVELEELDRVYVAGGFGNYLDVRNAVLIGLLPDVPAERIRFIGNGAVAGAKAALLSFEAWRKAHAIAGKMAYQELSVDPGFAEEYVSALFLPHTDAQRFPRVAALLGLDKEG